VSDALTRDERARLIGMVAATMLRLEAKPATATEAAECRAMFDRLMACRTITLD
jgi:hypothetical protein